MITLKQILDHGAVTLLKYGPPDNLSDAMEYLKQGTEQEQGDAQAIMDAIALMEVTIIASPNEGTAVIEHLTKFLERHK